MDQSFQSNAGVVALAWLAVWALLQFEHSRWANLDFRIRYILGMGTVCIGCLGAGIVLGNAALAIVPGVLATAGLPILLSYAKEDETEKSKKAAQSRGEVLGRASALRDVLTQERIDRGDDPTRN